LGRGGYLDADPLIGAWRLTGYEFHAPNHEVQYPYGPTPAGYLIYSADGYMAVSFGAGDRPPYAGGDRLRATPAELAAATRSFQSYSGRYTVYSDRVIHHIEASLFPNWVGVDQVRYYALAGDTLILRTDPLLMDGQTGTLTVTWRRASTES
jgi:hypothetical protein